MGNRTDNERPLRGYESILSSFNDAVIILSSSGDIEWINPAAEHISGLSLGAVRAKPMETLFLNSPDLLIVVNKSIDEGISLIHHDASYISSSGAKTAVGVTIIPGEEDKGPVIILRDLTNIKALERFTAIDERMEELSTLAAGVAHEIKNPLGGVLGAAQLLEREIDPSLHEYTKLIIKETDRINRLVVKLIELNQPESAIKLTPCNIYPAIDNAVRLLTPDADKKNVSFIKKYDPSLPLALGDPDKLLQIFLNLIKNGVEASNDGAAITIETSVNLKPVLAPEKRKNLRYITIKVMDEGSGLNEADEKKIFAPFFTRKSSGTGLGLSVSLRLAQAHGGFLKVANRNDGLSGVVASLYLPYQVIK